jgi:hypothetical protein
MTGTDPQKPGGYRGALPERNDTLAKPWILAVVGIFVLILVLSALEVPSRFIPDPTPVPVPSFAPSDAPSAEPSAEESTGSSAEPSGAPSVVPSDGSAAPSASP